MPIEMLGADRLASRGFEVQRTNNFEIQILSSDTTDKTRELRLAVVSGFLPNESNETIMLNYGNTQISVAGVAKPNNSGTLVVRDFIEKDTEKFIDDWRAQVYDKDTNAIHFAYEYKKDAKIIQYAPDGTYQRIWDLEGVWPSAVDYGQISYDSPGVKSISITLQYDKAKINRIDYNEGSLLTDLTTTPTFRA